MEKSPLENEPNQSTILTKKSTEKKTILIRPDNEYDLNDLIQITHYPAGKKTRLALGRLAQKYGFNEKDYKHSRISITLDFGQFKQESPQQRQQNSKK